MSKVQTIIDELKNLTLLEASELVKAIEETFGVSAAAPVAVAAAPTGDAGAAPKAEEQSEFDVIIEAVPADKKIAVIKEIKNYTGKGLGDAKAMADNVPLTLAEKLSKEDATKLKDLLSAAGATVTLK